jgi:hypothetical protein
MQGRANPLLTSGYVLIPDLRQKFGT